MNSYTVYHQVGFSALLGLALATPLACSSNDKNNASSESSSTGDSAGASSGGTQDPPCTSGQFRCVGNAELDACFGDQFAPYLNCDTTEKCDEVHHGCSCELNSTRCININQFQVCEPGTGGLNTFETKDCKLGEACINSACVLSVGICEPEGAFSCAPDGDTVLHCQKTGADQHLDWVPNTVCSSEGFANGCLPSPGAVNKSTALCLNACNVRGVALGGAICDPAPGLTCGVLVCNAAGTALIPDHAQCSKNGLPCSKDEDCATCHCQNGQCFGASAGHCGAAKELCN